MNLTNLTTKPHYPILDGLRGIAALMVVLVHLLGAHPTSQSGQILYHGYLAVDFFFLLSGFVIGYAYDDSWRKMTAGDFFKRRLVRLQPMVILGSVIGAVCFYFQACAWWPQISYVPRRKVLLIMAIGCTMLPVPPSMDIRGWRETYPLNGPAWSLFFEYLVNIFYGVAIRKFSKKALTILVFLSAITLVHLALTSADGSVNGGWTLDAQHLHIGFVRVLYPFFAGLLLFRTARLISIKNAFLWSGLLLIAVLAMPRAGGDEHLWINGLYDALSIILIFPLIVFLGASRKLDTGYGKRICRFLGDISYPVYITHYPLVCVYMAWVYNKNVSLREGLPVLLFTFLATIAIAYACLKLYDEPVRLWLKRKFLSKDV